jgi:5'-nucleotidase
MLRILISNDDGINEPGLRNLVRALAGRCEITVIAPDTASSATSHSITIGQPIYVRRQGDYAADCGVPGAAVSAYACSGKPTDCVMLGLEEICKDRLPHLVLSGINNGCNVAEDMSYSGTLGAALEAAVLGTPGIALSLDTERRESDFSPAAELAGLLLAVLVYGRAFAWQTESLSLLRSAPNSADADLSGIWPLEKVELDAASVFPDPQPDWFPQLIEHAPCFNINIPALPQGEVRGIRWTVGGVRDYVDSVLAASDPSGQECYFIGGEKVMKDDDTPGTDTHALKHGFVGVTPVTYDLSNRHEHAQFRQRLAERAGWPAPAGRGIPALTAERRRRS